MSTRVLYSNFLAEKLMLEAPYEQYGFCLPCGAGVFVLREKPCQSQPAIGNSSMPGPCQEARYAGSRKVHES